MSSNKVWEYRVVHSKKYQPSDDNSISSYDDWYSVQEVYYDDDGQPMAQTVDLQVGGKSVSELKTVLSQMTNCLKSSVLNENDITSTPSVEETEEKIGTDGHGNEIYVYESPDGGETIFRREFGKYDGREKIRENMKNLRTGKKTTVEDVPLPQGSDYHGDGYHYSKWSRKEEADDKNA